jgi:7-cyano-7-deazaguanine synthase in queuosine biosynthesis
MKYVFVRRTGSEKDGADMVLQPGKNLRTGEADFAQRFGTPTSLEKDLLLLAASTFAADRAIARGPREDQNRSIRLSIPVTNTARLFPLKDQIEDLLHTLSHDDWRIDFRQEKGSPENKTAIKGGVGSTLLFSGGLDSLAAAIQFGRSGNTLHLVSHLTRNRPARESQEQLFELLQKANYNVEHSSFFVSAVSSNLAPGVLFSTENSQRTRSFLFATLGALSARRNGDQRLLFVAENGQLAIHLPLNSARVGAFSTHTAHPDALRKMQDIFAEALGIRLQIVNPYEHMTKAEVVKIIQAELASGIELSVSCWMNARLPKGVSHCGHCIPCIIRRIAIETNGEDHTSYQRDLFVEDIRKLPPSDDGRRNLYDFVEFNFEIERLSPAEISDRWPEVITLSKPEKVIQMYKRAAIESRKVLGNYSSAATLLK